MLTRRTSPSLGPFVRWRLRKITEEVTRIRLPYDQATYVAITLESYAPQVFGIALLIEFRLSKHRAHICGSNGMSRLLPSSFFNLVHLLLFLNYLVLIFLQEEIYYIHFFVRLLERDADLPPDLPLSLSFSASIQPYVIVLIGDVVSNTVESEPDFATILLVDPRWNL